jgi:hypothetical protein
MRRGPKSLNAQLDAYFATAKPLTAHGGARLGHWSVYATVTGSALAMTTSASASIIYEPVNRTASVASIGAFQGPNTIRPDVVPITAAEALPNSHVKLYLSAHQGRHLNTFSTGTNFGGQARIEKYQNLDGFQFGFLRSSNSAPVKRLASGNRISSRAGLFGGVSSIGIGALASRATGPYAHYFAHNGTTPIQYLNGLLLSAPMLFGFDFKTAQGQTDYGWLRLKFTESANGLPNSVTLIDLAYNDDGSAILAGQTAALPEPGTFGLAVLAMGAAGVLALRKRRQLAGKPH